MPGDAASDTAPVEWQTPPPDARPFWRRIPATWLLWGVIIIGGGIVGAIVNAYRSDDGAISKAGDLQASELRVGDCFNFKDPDADVIEDVSAVPCDQAHKFELFLTKSMSDGDYPSDEAFVSFIEVWCVPEFGRYVGLSYEQSELDIYWLTPTQEGWADGDRTVQCAVFHPLRDDLTESQKGANR